MTTHDDHDESLANLLNVLTITEPDPGFTQRMVRGVEAQQALAVRPTGHARLIGALSFATATAAIVALAVTMHHSPHPVEQVAAIPPTQNVRPPQKRVILSETTSPKNLFILSEVRRASSANGVEASASASNHVHRRPEPTPQTEAELDPSRAKSFPAPPMPITEQEKLLLRIAHTGDPVEFAALNAEKRKRAAALYEEAYVKAFPPGLSAEAEDELVLKISKGETQ